MFSFTSGWTTTLILFTSYSCFVVIFFFFFFNDTATTEIYTLSLHDALPIFRAMRRPRYAGAPRRWGLSGRSEEHTSELQSRFDLVCRLLLEKKKNKVLHPIIFQPKKKNVRSYQLNNI